MYTKALMLGLVACGLQAVAPSQEVPARPLEWSSLDREAFDRRWILPETPAAEGDLLEDARGLLAAPIPLSDGQRLTFGDLVLLAWRLEGGARSAWLSEVLADSPRWAELHGEAARALLLDEELFAASWSPEEDSSRDGLLMAPTLELGDGDGEPWRSVGVTPRLEQAATLLSADLAAIKAVENDYRTYLDHVGADYEFIRPLEGRHFRGRDAEGRPFSAVGIEFRCDLPFPFGHYDCELRILNRYADDGTPRTDIYSTSGDFHWLASRDVFLAVRDSSGERVAWLLVRHFGFDLDGVPDRSRHRAQALRSSLGNLRRKAEDLVRSRSTPYFDLGRPQDLTHFRVRGLRVDED